MIFDEGRALASDRLLLIEAWINVFLLTSQIILGFFCCIRNVDRLTRVIIAVALLIDLTSMVMICIGALDQVTLFNQAHTVYSWYIEVPGLFTQLSGLIEQGVFLRRYWQHTREPFVSVVIWLLMLGRVILCAALTGTVLSRGFTAIRFANVATMTIAALSAFTDTCLMLLLIWRIRGIKMIYGSRRMMLKDVILYTTTNGCISALSTLLLLTMLFVNYHAYHFISFTLGRIYTLSAVITLTVAQQDAREPHHHGHSNQINSSGPREGIASPIHTHPLELDMLVTQFTDMTHHLDEEGVNRSVAFSSKRLSSVSISPSTSEGFVPSFERR